MYRLIKLNGKREIVLDLRALILLVVVIFLTNLFTYRLFYSDQEMALWGSNDESLYLMHKAQVYIDDPEGFEDKVRHTADRLNIPPEWLMAVMYSESKFNSSVENHKGSGAVGLIQWMPATIKDFGVSVNSVKNAGPIKQMDYVYKYLNNVKDRYGEFKSLTDLYLAILYPRALGGDYCYTLYAKPSVNYEQNSGLDHNKDGRVTVRDIDKHMEKIYPTAFFIAKDGTNSKTSNPTATLEAGL